MKPNKLLLFTFLDDFRNESKDAELQSVFVREDEEGDYEIVFPASDFHEWELVLPEIIIALSKSKIQYNGMGLFFVENEKSILLYESRDELIPKEGGEK